MTVTSVRACGKRVSVVETPPIPPSWLIVSWPFSAVACSQPRAYPAWGPDGEVSRGWKVPSTLPRRIPVVHPGIVLESGSLGGNGLGTVITTEPCLLAPNRDPTRNKSQIEEYLRSYLRVTHSLWPGDRTEGTTPTGTSTT